jgi:hypothetical protein
MRFRTAMPLLFALALVGGAVAQAASYEIRTTGTVISKSPDAIVLRIDDHGHRIRFDVDRSTTLPDDVAVGRHVSVTYHPTGTTGQAADAVAVVPRSDIASTAWAQPPANLEAKRASN